MGQYLNKYLFLNFIYLLGVILMSSVKTSVCSSTQPIKLHLAPSSWTAVAWAVPSFSLRSLGLVIGKMSIFAVARSQSNFALLVFLGVPCIGRTSASTSLLHSSYKQCYAFRMKRVNIKYVK